MALIACGNCYNWVYREHLNKQTTPKPPPAGASATPPTAQAAPPATARRRGTCQGAMPGATHDPNEKTRITYWPTTYVVDGFCVV